MVVTIDEFVQFSDLLTQFYLLKVYNFESYRYFSVFFWDIVGSGDNIFFNLINLIAGIFKVVDDDLFVAVGPCQRNILAFELKFEVTM